MDSGGKRDSIPEREAFEELLRLHYDRTYRAAFVIAYDRQVAEDAVQEAFLRAYRNLASIRDRGKAGAWLAVTAMNEARRLCRRRGRLVPLDAAGVGPVFVGGRGAGGGDDRDLAAAEARAEVARLFRRLSPADRQVLVLKYFFQLADDEVAELLGIPAGTVKSRLNRVRRRCSQVAESGWPAWHALAGTGEEVNR